MSKPFENVASLKPRRSVFDLSYNKKFTCDMGQLIPVLCEEMVPGDKFHIGNNAIVRFQPLVAPVLHQISMYVHYFFVPYRLLWSGWENFITGGVDGQDASVLPYWNPTNTAVGSLWDFLGFPTGVNPGLNARPINFPQVAYNLIFNTYYRDETLQTEVNLTTQESILLRNWEKDYFTSSLPWQQRGISPALPISGTTSAVWNIGSFANGAAAAAVSFHSVVDNLMYVNNANGVTSAYNMFNSNTVNLASATTFNIKDLRLAFQIQRWMERNARAGVRYTEFLTAHFGVSPRDERLQRPEYIGGSKSPIIISEVLKTSSTDATSPQGNMAGHGITVSEGFAGTVFAQEFGLIMGIMSVMPKPAYSQGINRQWLRQTKYDFYFPEFANLSEQAIYNNEICSVNADPTHNNQVFGYQGRYDEMRYKPNMVCSGMRSTYNYWHLSREFNPAAPPILNSTFIQCVPRKGIFAAPSEPGLIVEFGNLVKGIRPIPITAEPGLIDHD